MSQPKVSVVIPVYNVEAYLDQCLDSVQNQTLQEIEIICVDDCSKDGSLEILRHHEQGDSRIHIFRHEQNKSVFTARKTGVSVATGEYILFLDSDDYLEPTACEELYNKAVKENVDILHFSSRVVCCGASNADLKKQTERLLRPYAGKLTGSDVFSVGFAGQKVWGTLWNKLYRGEVCKKAFAELGEAYYSVGEDIFTFCAIAYYAQSYLGWKSKPLHSYRIGNGISTGAAIGIQQFQRQCVMAQVNQTMVAFCKARGVYEIAAPFVDQLRKTWLNHCCISWYEKLPKDYAAEGWELLCNYWGAKNIVPHIARQHFANPKEISDKLEQLSPISLKEKNVRTVGMYYHRMYNGGIERVISVLAPMFLDMGYRVVVITDEPPRQEDFALPKEVVREVIFSNQETSAWNIDVRLAAWTHILEKHSIDVVLYNAWTSELLLWDMLYIKGMGTPVVVHTHGVFSCTIVDMKGLFAELASELHLADGVVTLSEMDKLFWNQFQENVYCIPNPVSAELRQAKAASWENQSLIWVGRASSEKQPEKAFAIMQQVALRAPQAKLYVLGSFEDPKWKKLVRNMGLEENVIFCGLVRDVNPYLQNASVYIATSQFEGFPMSLVEAQAHKLPTVMFRLPNLTMAAEGRGVISVDMGDEISAAEEVLKLLRDGSHWQKNSEQAYSSYQWLRDYDLSGAWNALLTGEIPESDRMEPVAQMLDMLISHYNLGLRNRNSGSALLWSLQKIAGGIQCGIENGWGYTFRLALRRIRQRFIK